MEDSFPGFFCFINQPFRPLVSASRPTASVSVTESSPSSLKTVKSQQHRQLRSSTAPATMATPQSLTVTIIPASTKAGEETVRALLALTSNSDNKTIIKINAIYRDPSKAPTDFVSHPSVTAVKGNVGNLPTLDFKTSDVVFYIPPPTYDGTDTESWAYATANNVKAALSDAAGKVKKLVLFSAIGAQHDHGIGILKLNHITDSILTAENVNVPEKVVIRPGYFIEGFAPFLEEAIGTGGISSWLTPLEYRAPIVSVKDIASTCAKEILKPFHEKESLPGYIKIFGPRHYSAHDLHEAISTVLDRKDIKLNPVPPENLAEYFGQVFPPQYVQEFIDMTTAVLPGGVMARDFGYDDEDDNNVVVRGETELLGGIRAVYEGILRKEKEANLVIN
ncbi:NAD(P)H azoreductase [Rhypophila sp. PSN 637]